MKMVDTHICLGYGDGDGDERRGFGRFLPNFVGLTSLASSNTQSGEYGSIFILSSSFIFLFNYFYFFYIILIFFYLFNQYFIKN